MNSMKKTILALGLMSAGLVSAQNADMRNMIKVGVNGGLAVPAENAGGNLGLDVSYQNLVTPGFGLGIATGYSHFFGKSNTVNGVNIDNNDFGVVPVAALIRVYPKQYGFYLGTDLGYGFIVGDSKVAANNTTDRPDGGFYIKPEIGYHNEDWNFSLQYQKTFTGSKGEIGDQKYNAGAIGVGVGYNIPLGK
ncbi:porin family protein [Kaistella sp. DKR-2]|uniref:porin family protein n=1 Tax=Kaistella soli TaxID=2849654 RepID=UPI001C26381D|nr:porin family protein [Kaistella soli]MBU8881932.1 porin family protein [Kaistella soli]